jgi:hypothetical protein
MSMQTQGHDPAGDGAAETLAAADAAAEGLGHLDDGRINVVMMGEEDRFAAVAAAGEVMTGKLADRPFILLLFVLKEAAQVNVHA